MGCKLKNVKKQAHDEGEISVAGLTVCKYLNDKTGEKSLKKVTKKFGRFAKSA